MKRHELAEAIAAAVKIFEMLGAARDEAQEWAPVDADSAREVARLSKVEDAAEALVAGLRAELSGVAL